MAIQLPANGAGTIVDTTTLSGKDREIVNIGGNTVAAEVAGVKNTAPAETLYGLTTRPILRKDGETLSTANLGSSGVFTQAWQDGARDGVVFVEASARADQISATAGFVIEESDDSADANFTVQVAAGTAAVNTLLTIRAAITRRFWRVVFTNGGTGQTSFRLTASATNIVPGHFPTADFNTDANNQDDVSLVGIALPGASGPVIGGTVTNPLVFTDDGNAIIIDGSAVTQPISAASLPLPTGAATNAAQLPDGHNVTVDNASIVVTATALDIRALDNTDVVTIEAGADGTEGGAHGASQTGFRALGSDGTSDLQIRTDATGNLQVDVLAVPANQTVDLAQIAGNTTLVGNGSTGTGSQRVTIADDNTPFPVNVAGTTAADAASPNPVVIGFVASSVEPAEMSTNGDSVKAWADRFGRLVVVKNFPSDVSAAAHGPVTLTKTTDTIQDVVAAPSAGQSIYVTGLSCSNTSATAVRIDISDGSAVRDSMFLAADGGGYVKSFDPPWELTAATALRATASAAVTDIRINAHFYIMPDSTA